MTHTSSKESLSIRIATTMALFCVCSPAWAQDHEFTPVDALLRYAESEQVEEQAAPQSTCSGGGSLAAAMDCVAETIESGGEEGGGTTVHEVETGAVSASFTLTPVLLPIPDGELFEVRFRTAGGSVSVGGEIDNDTRSAADSDARLVRERLRRYRVNLDETQVARLRAGDSVDIAVETPFFGLQRLLLQAPVTASVYLPSDDIVRSIDFIGEDPASMGELSPAEIALAVIDPDTPFRLHVTYDNPPAKPPLSITLLWPGGSQRVGLRATEDPIAFTSNWYVVDAASVRRSREGSRLPGSGDPMSPAVAELFAGQWNVTHSGGAIGEAGGVAYVAPGGDTIRLFLDAGGQASRYESIEIVGTRDRTGGRHTLDARFLRKGDNEGWGPPLSHSMPAGQVLFVPDGTREMRAELRGVRQQVDVRLREAPDLFRVSLGNLGEAGLRLSGPWDREKPDGSLQGEGQQTWGLPPRIDGIVVLEDQRPQPPRLGDLATFMNDDRPLPADYILRPGPDDANRTTDYPFRDNAQNDTTYRTLFVYGRNLPQRGSDAMNLGSGDGFISYELKAFPGEGHDALFQRGRQKRAASNRGAAGGGAEGAGDATELILTAHFTEGVLPSPKLLTINTAPGYWPLEFADANVFPQFSHRWREDLQTEAGEFTATEIAYLGNNVYLTLQEQTKIPHDSLQVRLTVAGRLPLELSARRSNVAGEPAYISPPIRVLRKSLYEQQDPPDEVDGARVVLADPGDRLEAELVNPYLVRAIPVKVAAQVVPGPRDSTLWKDALKRVAACFNESNIDIDSFTNEESDTYAKFIFTENMLQMVSPLLFGAFSMREISISKGDHAAAILIRDQFLQNLNNVIPELISTINDDEKMWRFYQTRSASNMPFWNLVKVQGPGEEMESVLGAFITEFGLQVSEAVVADLVRDMARSGADMMRGDSPRPAGEWPIGDLVDVVTTNPEAFGNSQRHAHLYAFRKTKEALQRLVDSASNAYARATNAGDCNVQELMLIAGQDEPGIVASILPRLVRPVENGSESWERDVDAQDYVSSLHGKGASIRALGAYARIDETYQAMALAAVTAGAAAALTAGGAALAGAYMMLAVDVADMALYGSAEFSRYLESQPLIDYAVGATAGGFSESFYDEAMAMRTEGWEAAAALLGPALGAGMGVFDVSSALRANRGARVLDEIESLDRAAIEGLALEDQRNLFSYFADLEARKPGSRLRQANNLGRTHTEAEAADFERFTNYLADNGVDAAGPGVRAVERSSETPGGASSALDDLFGEPVTTTRIDPLDNAPPTVRVSEDPETGATRLVRAEHEDVPITRSSSEGDITNPAEALAPPARSVADNRPAPTVPTARDPPRVDDPDARAPTVRVDADTVRADADTVIEPDTPADPLPGPARRDAPEEDPTPRFDAVPETPWTDRLADAGPMRIVDENGQEQILHFGRRRGEGAGSIAIENGDGSGTVLRIDKTDTPSARANDDFGRKHMQRILDENPEVNFVALATEHRRIVVRDSDIPELNGRTIDIVDEVENTAARRIADQGGQATPGQLRAMDAAKRLLNRNGYFWSDGHLGNFDIVPIEGTADSHRVVIFDTGHLYPVRGDTPFERWRNARELQEEIANPPEAYVTRIRNARNPETVRDAHRQRLMEIFSPHKPELSRIDWEALPPEMKGIGGTPDLSTRIAGYAEVAARDPHEATFLFNSTSPSSLPPPPRPTPEDLARDPTAARFLGDQPGEAPEVSVNTRLADADDPESTVNFDRDPERTTGIDPDETINENIIPDRPGAEAWSAHPSEPGRWVTPEGEALVEGPLLGRGKYADVKRLLDENGEPSGSVVKILDVNTGEGVSTSARHLLNQQAARVLATQEGARLLDEAGILNAEIRHVDPVGRRMIQREVNADLPPGVRSETLVESRLADGSETLSKAESEAVARLFKRFNDHELRVEDPNSGNIFIREHEGASVPLEAGVLDQDRIIGAEDFSLLDHMEEAIPSESTGILRQSEVEVNGLELNPEKWVPITHGGQAAWESRTNLGEFKKLFTDKDLHLYNNLFKPEGVNLREFYAKAAGETYLDTPKKFNYYALIEKGWLKYEPGAGLQSGRMDIEAAAEYFPDLPETLGIRGGDRWEAALPPESTVDGAHVPAMKLPKAA